ncbi:hypothetical protein L551_3558 [Bordetella pertussis STO1-SEAT-0004]|nr:hypothetical protein L565_3559 [Bordetella pertussis CHLA-20]ETI04236.1 hypothetical protein L551_3558 [Bordetella pertussis STO1-SEAT-0004]
MGARQFPQPALQRRAGLARLGKARGKHHEGPHPGGDALADHALDQRGRRADDGQVDRLADGRQRRIAFDALHLGAGRIDRKQFADESARQHIGQRPAGDLAGVGGGPDDGHAARLQHRRRARRALPLRRRHAALGHIQILRHVSSPRCLPL